MSTMTMRNSMRKSSTLTSAEGTTEEFSKAVYTSLSKVINNKEIPPKQKHIRIAVMSTHRERGASTFWSIVVQMGLQGHDVTAYKFCLVTHNVLRDGHPNALADSARQIPFLDTLSRLWTNMADGYGRTTAFYCDLLVNKLKFHERNPLFPGNLHFENISTFEEEYDSHPDNLFNLCAELFDYLEASLTLQSQIFKVIERGRWGTATAQSQCFLSPLVPLIQDTCQLYDLIVRSMFKLHSTLPSDFLLGHVDRFKILFQPTKQFFSEAARLTYVKSFMHLPSLSVAPDFSRVAQKTASKQHYAPVEIIKQPASEQGDYDYYYEDDSSVGGTSASGTLVDVQDPAPPPLLPRAANSSLTLGALGRAPDVIPKRSPPEVPPLPPQIEMYSPSSQTTSPVAVGVGGGNEEMQAEIDYLLNENEQLRERQRQQEVEMSREISEIQERFIQLKSENQQLKRVAMDADSRVEQLSEEMQQQSQMYADKLKASSDKFNKITEIYTKLREDHLKVLRAKGELQKQLNMASESNQLTLTDSQLRQQTQQEEVERARVDVGQLNKQIAEMEERSQEQNSLLGQKMKQLDDATVKINVLTAQIETSQKFIESIFGYMSESLSTALDVENPCLTMQIERTDELVNIIQNVIVSWKQLHQAPDEHSRSKTVLKMGDDLYLVGVIVASILQFLPITSSVRNSLLANCRQSKDIYLSMLDALRQSNGKLTSEQLIALTSTGPNDFDLLGEIPAPDCFAKLLQTIQELKDEASGVEKGAEIDLEQVLEDEMRTASRAVDEASNKFQDLLKLNSEENSGVKLQVHSSLIASCSKLMTLIKQLMLAVKAMQQELVDTRSKSSNKKEFYAKNSSWTEGLISGGKSLGLSANMLVETADAAMKGSGRFVAINACAKGIVSAIAHLVLATKVQQQASPQSVLAANQVTSLAKQVQASTGEVIAATQQAQSLEENSSLMDFSSLNLHQAKQKEMESHIKLMELEASVERERTKLGDLRRHHYKLAAAAQQEQQDQESG